MANDTMIILIFFTALYLLEQSILATGTMRVNRHPGLPVSSPRVRRRKRGKMKVCTTLDVNSVRWTDNKVV